MKEYFPHDFGARHDPKLIELHRQHAMIGIGVYWCIVEITYENNGEIPKDYVDRIAYELRVELSLIESILNDFELFYFQDDVYRSESADRRISERLAKSDKARESAQKGWENRRNNNQPKKRTPARPKQDKIEGAKKIEYAPDVRLSDKEHADLTSQYGKEAVKWMCEKLSAYKESTGRKYKSDAGAIRSWVVNSWAKEGGNKTVTKPAKLDI
jgi:uncharacterized protein YdaU (DUF1376 family)